MKTLSKKATQIFISVISNLNEEGSAKLQATTAYLPLYVERIELLNRGDENEVHKVSFAHYGKQNGDLMRDPEMLFLYYPQSEKVIPYYYRNDYAGYEDESVFFDDNGQPDKYNRQKQQGHAQFAEMWLNNIMEQQEIKL